jgi:hypothetical protein
VVVALAHTNTFCSSDTRGTCSYYRTRTCGLTDVEADEAERAGYALFTRMVCMHPMLQPRTSWRAMVGLILALGDSACATAPSARLQLSYSAHDQYASTSLYRADIAQSGHSQTVHGSSMQSQALSSGYLSATSGNIRLRAGEAATVNVHLHLATGEVTEAVTWTPQNDWEYGVAAVVATHRPQGICIAIVHARPLPATLTSTADTLFILQSGLPKGAVC